MRSRIKQLGSDSVVYGFGGALAKCVGFCLMPLYTRVFSPSDYGTIDVLVVVSGLLGALLVMGMDSAQSFYFSQEKERGITAQSSVVTAILQWRLVWGIPVLILAVSVSPLINTALFDGRLSWHYFAFAFVGTFFVSLMSQSIGVFRLLYQPWRFIGISLGHTLLAAAITVTGVLCFRLGILSFFVGMALSAAVLGCIAWGTIRRYLDLFRWHTEWWPRVIRFGAPLMPATLAMYVLNTADRWFLIHYRGTEEVGVYAIGAKFAMLVAFVAGAFRKAWWPVAMDAINSPDGSMFFRVISRLYLGVASAGIVLLTALAPILVNWLTPPQFHGGYAIVGILSWHSVFYGFFLIGSIGIWKAEKTYWVSIGMALAAVLNIVLDFLLVPRYGGVGAAIGTSISFFVWNIFTFCISEKLWPVQFPVKILALQVFLGVSACASILVLQHGDVDSWKVWVIAACVCLLLIRSTASGEHWSKAWHYVLRQLSGISI